MHEKVLERTQTELEKIYQPEDYEEGKDPEEEKDNDDKENEEGNGSENKAQKLARNKRKKGILLNSRMPLRYD